MVVPVSEASMLEISESLTLPVLIDVLIVVSDGLSVAWKRGMSDTVKVKCVRRQT